MFITQFNPKILATSDESCLILVLICDDHVVMFHDPAWILILILILILMMMIIIINGIMIMIMMPTPTPMMDVF